MKQIPNIEKFMTPMPHSINVDLPIKSAKEMMTKYGIRHIPVQDEGKLVGVITDRDVKLAISLGENADVPVSDVMTQDPYFVMPHTPLDIVVGEMAEKKIGCTIIKQENGKIVGIFTSTDGLRAFGEILQTRFKQ